MSNNISIRNIDPQEITINSENVVYGITNVYVNGVDVTVGSKAYVVVPTKTSELTNDSGFITNAEEIDPTVPYYVKEITMADINAWNDKQDLLVSGTSIKTINGESILGSGNISVNAGYTAGTGIDIIDDIISNTITSYNDLTDLPTIPDKTSQLINDSGFITNTVDDLTNYMNIDFLNKLLPKSTDSGSELYLADTADLPLRLDLNPSEITQHTTRGINLLNPIGESKTENDITFTNNGDGTFTANGTASANTNFPLTILTDTPITLEANESYTQSLNVVSGTFGGSIVPAFKNGGGTISYNYFNSTGGSPNSTKTPTEEMYAHSYNFYISSGTSITNCTFKVQLEKGSTATTYEEYTGGVASPNINYPQDLHTVNGSNVITVMGKNLFDKSTVTSGKLVSRTDGTLANNASYSASDYIPVKSGTTYTQNNTNSYYSAYYDRNKVYVSECGSNTFTPSQDGYIRTTIPNANLDTAQIEGGSTATTYAPFESESYPIDLSYVYNVDTGMTEDLELTKINVDGVDYETFFFKNYKDSKYYNSSAPESTIYYNMGVYKYICNPDDAWDFQDNEDGTYLFELRIPDLEAGSIHHKLKSNYFLDISEKDPDHDTFAFATVNLLDIVIESDYGITTLEDWQDFITNNEVIFYIARAGSTIDGQRVSTIEKYTDLASQYHDVMDNAMCSDGATNVIQTNNDLPFDLKGSSYKKIS